MNFILQTLFAKATFSFCPFQTMFRDKIEAILCLLLHPVENGHALNFLCFDRSYYG